MISFEKKHENKIQMNKIIYVRPPLCLLIGTKAKSCNNIVTQSGYTGYTEPNLIMSKCLNTKIANEVESVFMICKYLLV